jgi:hypothetical protein
MTLYVGWLRGRRRAIRASGTNAAEDVYERAGAMYRSKMAWVSALGADGAGMLPWSYWIVVARREINLQVWLFLVAIALAVLAAPVGAYALHQRGWPEGRALLWASAALTSVLVIMTLPSFSLQFVPAAVLAVVAAVSYA